MHESWIQQYLTDLDGLFGKIVEVLVIVLFADLGTGIPLVVAVLLLGGIHFTFFFRWMSIRGFKHSIDVIRGRYDNPDDPGEISHFQALSSALSATIGLGNIAGVAIAVSVGGPPAPWRSCTVRCGPTATYPAAPCITSNTASPRGD